MSSNITVAQKRKAFRDLHESGSFLLPNAHDAGSALKLQEMGFSAVAPTSFGYALTVGDARICPSQWTATIPYLKSIADAVDLPINADFEAGFAPSPEEVARNVTIGLETGISGLSIEDVYEGRVSSTWTTAPNELLQHVKAADDIDPKHHPRGQK